MENYLKPYGDIELQRRMVSDHIRTDAFAEAIREVVQPGDKVLDVGTGTGILSMFAAQAGAARVDAIEASDIADVAKKLVAANGMSDQIHVREGLAGDLVLDEKVDVIVSEWLGSAAFAEGMLHPVVEARDNNLAPGGKMLPSKVRVFIAPIDEPIMYNAEGPGFWRAPIQGLDFSSLQREELEQGLTVQMQVASASVLAPGKTMIEIDLASISVDDVFFEGALEFVPERDGVLNGFCVWFDADLSPNVTLDTSPFCPETHWAQTYMSFTPKPVRAGEPLKVDIYFSYDSDTESIRRYVDLRIAVGDDELNYVIDD